MTNQLSEWKCLVKKQRDPRTRGLKLLTEKPYITKLKFLDFILKA